MALGAGSHYLLRYVWIVKHAQSCSQMMGLVAAVVAIVILVFFGLGYCSGGLFL